MTLCHLAGVISGVCDNNDLPYYLWVADQSDLGRINNDNATRVFDYAAAADPKTYPASFDQLDFNQVALLHTGFLSSYLLDEGDHWLYVTTEATGDWVIGVSDTFRVHHKPVFDDFYNTTLGTGLVFDDEQVATDFDDIFSTVFFVFQTAPANPLPVMKRRPI